MRSLYHPTFELDKIEAPKTHEHAADNMARLAATTSRRSFFGRTLATAAAGTAVVAGASKLAHAASPLPSLFPGSTAKYFQELQFDEASHVNINTAAIQSLGGTVRPIPTFTGITDLSAGDLLNLSVLIANTGVGALFGAAPYIFNPSVFNVAASILFVEAHHAGFLNTTANALLVPNGLVYDVPLTIDQVTAAISPYISSFNDPNNMFPATFSTTEKSTTNDIAILNFAIIIDQLEATLYYNNVPRLFG